MPLNRRALAQKDQALAHLLQIQTSQAQGRIRRKLDDAEAHATSAVTRAARQARAGRPTIAEIRQARGTGAAESRLGELLTDLVNLIEQAREQSYLAATIGWALSLDPAWLRPGAATSTQAGRDHARTLTLGGLTLRADLATPIDRARRDLETSLVRAATPAGPRAPAADELVSAWRDQAERAITATALGALQDSLRLIDRLAGRDVLDPRRVHPDPTLD